MTVTAKPDSAALDQRTATQAEDLLAQACCTEPDRREQLLNEVVVLYLPLARRLAMRYSGRGEEFDDLEQVARDGLVEASRRYQPGHGGFVAFAVPTIQGKLKRHFRDHGWLVRPPRQLQEVLIGVRRQWAQSAQELGSEPDDGALAAAVGVDAQVVKEARQAAAGYRGGSLDTPAVAGAESRVETGEDGIDTRVLIGKAIARLDEPERRLLKLRYVDELSQDAIATEIRTSQMQVSRLLARTHGRLREIIGEVG